MDRAEDQGLQGQQVEAGELIFYLLDTDTVSRLMKGEPRVTARLKSLAPDDRVFTTPTVRGEILFGIERLPQGGPRESLRRKFDLVDKGLSCRPVPAGAGETFALVKVERLRLGLSLDENDLWIAAAGAAYGATVVTSDGDFARLGLVSVDNWLLRASGPK